MLGLPQRGVAGRIENIGARGNGRGIEYCLRELTHAAMCGKADAYTASFERCRRGRCNGGDQDTLRNIDASRGGPAGDE